MQTSRGETPYCIWEFWIFVMIFQGISRRIQEFELEQIMLHPFMENPPCNRESLNSKSSMIINCMTVCFHDFVLVLFFSGWYWMISIESSKNRIIGKTWWHFPHQKTSKGSTLWPSTRCAVFTALALFAGTITELFFAVFLGEEIGCETSPPRFLVQIFHGVNMEEFVGGF